MCGSAYGAARLIELASGHLCHFDPSLRATEARRLTTLADHGRTALIGMDANSYPHRTADETTELLDWAKVEDPVHFQQRTIERDGKRVSDTQPSEILTGGPQAVFTDLAHYMGTVLQQKDALAATIGNPGYQKLRNGYPPARPRVSPQGAIVCSRSGKEATLPTRAPNPEWHEARPSDVRAAPWALRRRAHARDCGFPLEIPGRSVARAFDQELSDREDPCTRRDMPMAHVDTDCTHPGERRLGALLLIRDAAGHVLLVKPSYKDGWQLPGGGALPNEMPHLAARREGVEETGLTGLRPGDLLITDYVPANPALGAVEGINLVFDGGIVPGDTVIVLPAARPGTEPELVDWAFVSPQQLGEFCKPYQKRRIQEALAALADPSRRGYRVEGQMV
ncbi:NUDIX domain-containing protein [Streptomyces sp. NPDC048254]|uniref:NUDIX domain-containing protein n=1 Tax=Streptomyces sp. NPDC048254 TaxID=3365525 RepID=UPI003713BB5D